MPKELENDEVTFVTALPSAFVPLVASLATFDHGDRIELVAKRIRRDGREGVYLTAEAKSEGADKAMVAFSRNVYFDELADYYQADGPVDIVDNSDDIAPTEETTPHVGDNREASLRLSPTERAADPADIVGPSGMQGPVQRSDEPPTNRRTNARVPSAPASEPLGEHGNNPGGPPVGDGYPSGDGDSDNPAGDGPEGAPGAGSGADVG
jgi:hypothetical protein